MEKRITISSTDVAAIAGVLAMSTAAMGGVGETLNDEFPGDFYEAVNESILIQGDLEDRGCGYGYASLGPDKENRGGGYGGGCFPDVVLGIFENGVLIETDDDGSFLGDGLASGLFGLDVGPNGVIDWAVSGFDDFDFDGLGDDSGGPHNQLGAFEGFTQYYDADGAFVSSDYLGFYEFLNGDEVFFGTEFPPPTAVTYDIFLDNTVGSDCQCGDVDFQFVTGLIPGAEYEIRVTDADFDTILQTYDAFGAPLDFNDDDPDAGCCLSVLTATANENGSVYFSISGFGDDQFSGNHSEFGFWEIAVNPACSSPQSCNPADLEAPFNVLDLADIGSFVGGFTAGECIADLDTNGLYDLGDIGIFVTSFTGAVPNDWQPQRTAASRSETSQ
jgi:hypothetical protein